MSFALIPHHQGQNRFLFLGTFTENRKISRTEDVIKLLTVTGLCPWVLCILMEFLLGNGHRMKTNFHKIPLLWRWNYGSFQFSSWCYKPLKFIYFYFNKAVSVEGDQAKICTTMLKSEADQLVWCWTSQSCHYRIRNVAVMIFIKWKIAFWSINVHPFWEQILSKPFEISRTLVVKF